MGGNVPACIPAFIPTLGTDGHGRHSTGNTMPRHSGWGSGDTSQRAQQCVYMCVLMYLCAGRDSVTSATLPPRCDVVSSLTDVSASSVHAVWRRACLCSSSWDLLSPSWLFMVQTCLEAYRRNSCLLTDFLGSFAPISPGHRPQYIILLLIDFCPRNHYRLAYPVGFISSLYGHTLRRIYWRERLSRLTHFLSQPDRRAPL